MFLASPLPALLVRNADLVFALVNDAFVEAFGWSRAEFCERSARSVGLYAHVRDRDLLIDHVERHRNARGIEIGMLRRDGDVRTLQVSLQPVIIDDSAHTLVVLHDVTDIRRAQRALAQSEARFATAFMKNPLPAALMRLSDSYFLDVNVAFTSLFGYSREELIGRAAVELPFWADPTDRQRTYAKFFADGRLVEHPVCLMTKAAERRELLWTMEHVDVEGEACVLFLMQNVTERKRDEQALRDSEARFTAAFSAGPVPLAIVRCPDRKILAINDACVVLFGYEREELIGRCTDDFDFYSDESMKGSAYRAARERGKLENHEVKLVTKDGRRLDVLVSSNIIEIDGARCLLGAFQDITERKVVEAAVRESDARFRQLADNIREVFWIAEPGRKKLHYVSPAYEAIWGRSVERLMSGKDDWTRTLHPDDRERALRHIAEHERGEYEQKYRIVRPDGEVRCIHDRGFPVYDDAGNVIRVVGFAEDITDRLRLEDELRQTQKMESLGMLAGGVAHDFNNVLAVIASCNGILADALALEDPNRELVEEIDAAVDRAASLTRQLLAFSRKQVTDPKVIDLNETVADTRKMLRRMVGEDIVLTTSLEPDLGRVRVDPGYLVQVLMNLVVNARDAMPRGGTLAVATRSAMIDSERVRGHPTVKPGPAVLLEVSDTGSGMTPDVLERIFEPFFTTKPHGKGTGMGLAVVHGIIDQVGGYIDVESTVGVGTTFRVYLPVVDEATSSVTDGASAMKRGSERILLVDDDEHVRRSTARALRARGFDVIEASNGAAALAHLDSCERFELLLTDVVMPAMDGRQLAEQAHDRCPRLRILYMSGYTDDAVVRHGVMHGEVELIEKPFGIDALARRVRQVLDAPPTAETAGHLQGPQAGATS